MEARVGIGQLSPDRQGKIVDFARDFKKIRRYPPVPFYPHLLKISLEIFRIGNHAVVLPPRALPPRAIYAQQLPSRVWVVWGKREGLKGDVAWVGNELHNGKAHMDQ